jgi:DNA primase
MYNRSIFPIFDVNNNDSVVGLAGRTIDPKEKIKWKFNTGFSSGNHLFGYNRAVDTIRRTNSVVLVEGQGDVLRMHEAGVTNTVGIFGCNLSDPQSILLENASVLDIILMLDNDKAGRNAQEKIFNTYKTMFNFIEVKYDTKDPGELSIDQIQQTIVPQIEKYI